MTYTLSEKDVSSLHNAKVYLLYALEHCDGVFKEDSTFIQNMKRSMSYLEPVSTRLMKEADKIRDSQYLMAEQIAINNGFKNSIWSMYEEVESFESSSPVPTGAKLRSYYTKECVTVEGSTWLDLWMATDKLIKMTSDEHGDHVFIEAYRKVKSENNLYEVCLGS